MPEKLRDTCKPTSPANHLPRMVDFMGKQSFLFHAARAALLAGSIVRAAPALASEPQTGVYIGLGAGGSYQADTDITGTGTNAKADFKLGFTGLGRMGYAFKNGLRVEVEGSYRDNGLDSLTPSGVVGATTQFDRTNAGVMVNLAYDFHNSSNFVPTVGAGIGVAFTTSGQVGDRAKLAGQVMAGVGYQINDRITAFADYRFFATPEIDGRAFGTALSSSNFNHSIVAGLRFKLGDPWGDNGLKTTDPSGLQPIASQVMQNQLASVPAPAGDLPTNYMVFFDTNLSILSPKAQDMVRTAAANMRLGSHTRINVTGHTDRAGDGRYNEALSARRAAAVQQLLVASGIPSEEIVVMAKGESAPLVENAGWTRGAEEPAS